ncbi:MAG: lipoyl(octanoyl) transferase LipB [Actinomycetota bacterium]|nr:lipoyl(octanoyl) transferase LipB [Actinomycetota bacterium]
MQELWVAQLGRVPYAEATALQERLRALRQEGELPDVLLMLEHLPVLTKGRRTEPSDLPMGESWYELQGIEVAESDRGGRVTYHCPGQLVGYPIVGVRDVAAYVGTLERAIVDSLAVEGISAHAPEELTGVWSGKSKIGSIGVHVSRGVTTHGFAINVDCDLQPFEFIVPCGLSNVRMTSVFKETGRTGRMPCLRKEVAFRVAEGLGRRQRIVSLDRLLAREPHYGVSPAGSPLVEA